MPYANVNGLSLYYEEHGSGGTPLVLLHGGIAAGEMFAPVLPELAAHRRVITVDLEAHGHTADIGRPLRYESMADDTAALIRQLGLDSADLMGYSLGGGVAYRTAIQHPDVLRRLVVVSQPGRWDGWYPESRAAMQQLGPQLAEPMKQSPLYEMYARIAPQVADWPVLIGRVGDLISRDYDWTAAIAGITAPVMLVFADADAIRPAHIMELYALLGGGLRDAGVDGSGRPAARLAILPGLTHYSVFASPALPAAVVPFLDAEDLQPA